MAKPDPEPTATSSARLPRVVVWLGVVSLATDASTEMIYPLLPLFLTSVLSAGPEFVGVIEGAAEATASLLKLVSGRIADRADKKKPLTLFGYGVSSLVRPLTGLAQHPWVVLLIRLTDRFGKGVRSSPRDALLAEAAPPRVRGRAYGFHNAMDNAGAVIGPALATALLAWGHLSLRTVFLLSAVPGAVAMAALAFGVREPARDEKTSRPDGKTAPRESTRALVPLLFVVCIFALGNSSDAFLLLRARDLGVGAAWIPLLWMVHNGTKAALGTTGGSLSDRLGRRKLIIAGWAVYAASYLGFAFARATWHAWALFVVYGLYYALVEGAEKALIADLAPSGARGRAFGLYYAVVGLAALPSSFAFGVVAEKFGAKVAFTGAAALAAAASLLLAVVVREPRRSPAAPPGSA